MNETKVDIIRQLKDGSYWGTENPYEVLDSSLNGTGLWVRLRERETSYEFVACVDLTMKGRRLCCHRAISMDAGPWAVDCPMRLLKGLSPRTENGREWIRNAEAAIVRARAFKAFRASIHEGSVLKWLDYTLIYKGKAPDSAGHLFLRDGSVRQFGNSLFLKILRANFRLK